MRKLFVFGLFAAIVAAGCSSPEEAPVAPKETASSSQQAFPADGAGGAPASSSDGDAQRK